jgi:hypothetical protein
VSGHRGDRHRGHACNTGGAANVDGGEFDIYLRLLKEQAITVLLNTNHRVNEYAKPD